MQLWPLGLMPDHFGDYRDREPDAWLTYRAPVGGLIFVVSSAVNIKRLCPDQEIARVFYRFDGGAAAD